MSDDRAMGRRAFLAGAGLAGAAAVLGVGVARPAAGADDSLAPFRHGVASGDPLPDGVILWTRVTPHTAALAAGPIEVTWRVAADVELTRVVSEGQTTTDAARDFTVKVDTRGLLPGTWYFYEFSALGMHSIVGRTKTAPTGGVDHLRFAVVSCSSLAAGYFNAFARLSERDDLDAVLHLGDYLYEFGGAPPPGEYEPRQHDPPHEIVTLADYRARHAQYKLDPDLRRLHQLHPFVTVWDDHEFTDGAWKDGASGHQPDTEGPWPRRKAAAQRAYNEWMPIRTNDTAVIYRSLRFGDLADLVMLDTRIEGRDQQVADFISVDPAMNDPRRRLLSDIQRSWFFDQLSTSARRRTRWRLVGQQVNFGHHRLPGLPDIGGALESGGLPDVSAPLVGTGGVAIWPDHWEGYAAERAAVFNHLIANQINNVVVLTGDYHNAFAQDLTPDPYNPLTYNRLTGEGSVAVEFVATSVTSPGVERLFGASTPAIEAAFPVLNPHVRFMDASRRGYFILDVTRDAVQADFWFVDTAAQPSAGQSLRASWRTLNGSNRLSRAAGPAPSGRMAPARPSDRPRTLAAAATAPLSRPLPATGSDAVPSLGTAAALTGLAAIARFMQRRRSSS